jgi:hypothetical protein
MTLSASLSCAIAVGRTNEVVSTTAKPLVERISM